MGADNQQERSGEIRSYISGFVDGEGCFSITIQKSVNVKLGIQIIPEFHVSQHQNRTEVLELIKKELGCGYIKPNDYRNSRDQTSVYAVRNIDDLQQRVIPFFEKSPLISLKQKDFEKFSQVVSLMKRRQHLTKSGLIAILRIAYAMNFRGKYRKQKFEDIISHLKSSETVRQKLYFKNKV